jgi:cytochrome c oxidase subunit II
MAPALLFAAAGPVPARAAESGRPMYYLETFGAPGHDIAELTWGLIWLSTAVVAIIAALVLGGVLFRGRAVADMRADGWAVGRSHDARALRWVYLGIALTLAALTFFVIWTLETLAAVVAPAEEPAVTIEITGHQWWWEVKYVGDDVSRNFETANEIHVPVGKPVKLVLTSADVIHSFWVPAMAGKTDLIPGQQNIAWLRADRPGVYRGQCVEYCGDQHAHMALRLFADPPEVFQGWWDDQLKPVDAPDSAEARAGAELFRLHCSACHAVRGMMAGGEMGPDLSHLMQRTTIASGMLPNTTGHLSGWIANPDRLKPGTRMPRLDLSGPELDAIRAFLLTLQ